MQAPDFDGFGLLNLMATLEWGLGGESPYTPLPALGFSRVTQARSVVLLVVDGLGESRVQRHAPALLEHSLCSLSTVFPSATAPAITTLLTGAPPSAHAITGWNMEIAELDRVLTFLPFRARDGRPLDAEPASLLGASPFCERISRDGTVESVVISPQSISESKVNRALTGPADRRAFEDLDGLLREIVSAVKQAHKRRYVYAYWGELDRLSHAQGTEAPATLEHLRELSHALPHLADRLAGYDCLLLVTADHGFMDIESVCDLRDHPELQRCLRRPLCGEPRAAYCHVLSGQEARFVGYVQEKLGDRFELHASAALIDAGVFGPPPFDARLRQRVGDFVLLGGPGQVIVDRLPHESRFSAKGMHGGTSAAEQRVPLLAFGR